MRLVDDDRVIGQKFPIPLGLREQKPVGHQLDAGVLGRSIIKTDRVTHSFSKRGSEFFCDSRRDAPGGHPPRLGVADDSIEAAAELETNLR